MYDDLINAAAEKYGVDAKLIRAMIQHESGFNLGEVGDGGLARGLMQMHPAAAASVGADWSTLGVDPAYDIDKGTAYYALVRKLVGGDERIALMAYNQGPTVIGRALKYATAVLSLKGDKT